MGYLLQYQSHVDDLTSLAGSPEDTSWFIQQPEQQPESQPSRRVLFQIGARVGDLEPPVDLDDASWFFQEPTEQPRREPLVTLGGIVGDYDSAAANPGDTSWLVTYPEAVPLALPPPALGWFAGDLTTEVGVIFASAGMPVYWATANRPTNVEPFLEVFMRAVTGTAFARLFDATNKTAVPLTDISSSSTFFRRLRHISAATLEDDTEYQVALGVISGDVGEIAGAQLVVVYP